MFADEDALRTAEHSLFPGLFATNVRQQSDRRQRNRYRS